MREREAGSRVGAALRRCWGLLLAGGLAALLIGVVCFPVSLSPGLLSLAHRTASKHTVLMRHLKDLSYRTGGIPPPFVDLWGFPDGGHVQLIGVPSLAMGTLLCSWMPPRLVFNLLLMANLMVTTLTFYCLARKVGSTEWGACVFAVLVAFHPCLQSYIARGQIENTLLWPVALSLLAGASILASPGRALGAAFAHAVLPILIVFSTPYYAFFYLALAPFALLVVRRRLGVRWTDTRVRLHLGSGLLAALLVGASVQYYRPVAAAAGGQGAVGAGSLTAPATSTSSIESPADLLCPGRVLEQEKPYLGLALGVGLLGAFGAVLAGRNWRRGMAIPLVALLFFVVLAMGRVMGPAESALTEGIPLPAALFDSVHPGFRSLVKLFRALPFVAMCGAAVVAGVVNRLRPGWACVALAGTVLLLAADSFLVAPLSARGREEYCFDSTQDLDPAVRAIPRFDREDLPILDLPPPVPGRAGAWPAYCYYQTEHGQRMVWDEVRFGARVGLPADLAGLFARMAVNGQSDQLRRRFEKKVKEAGIGLVALHLQFADERHARMAAEALDACFARSATSERTVVWRVR